MQFPSESFGLPPLVIHIMNGALGLTNPHGTNFSQPPKEIRASLEPLLGKVTNPGVKFSLQVLAGMDAELQQEVQRRLAQPSPTANDWRLSAWVAQRQGDLKTAIEHLARASALEQDAMKRLEMDSNLFHYVLVAAQPPSSPRAGQPRPSPVKMEDVRQIVKETVFRLAQSPNIPAHIVEHQFAASLRLLGFVEEAEELRKQTQTTPRRGSRAGLASGQSQPPALNP